MMPQSTTVLRAIVCHKAPLGNTAILGLSCSWNGDRSPTRFALVSHQVLPATTALRLLLDDRPAGRLIHTPRRRNYGEIFLWSSVMDRGAAPLQRCPHALDEGPRQAVQGTTERR
jgi:hypothetical protein